MKKVILTSVFAFLCLFLLNAQVLEETRVMSVGSQPALTIILPGADVKFVEAKWKEYMKPYGKVVRIRSAKENLSSDIQILDIGGVARLNIYSLVEEAAEGAKMTAWFDLGPGFVSSESYPKEYVAGVKFLKDFAAIVKLDMITIELEEQQKLLGKAENSLSKLQRENESLHKIIEDSKNRIAKAEEDIQKNLKEQEMAQMEIELKKETVDSVQKKLDECKNQ